MTRGDIITDLKGLIGPGCEVSDGQLATWVNDYYMMMIDEISKVNPDYFYKSATTNVIANTREYQLPTDCEKIIMVNIKTDDTWQRALPMGNADIRFVGVHSATNNANGFTSADPRYYIIGDNIGIMPIPDDSVSSGLKVWYTYTPSIMDEDSDIPAIPIKYHYMIKYGAYANYLDEDDEHAAAEKQRQRLDKRIEQMIESVQDKQVDEVRSVEISQNTDMYSDDTYI